MGMQADIIEQWLLVDCDIKLRMVKRVKTFPEQMKTMGWTEKANGSVVTMKRHFVGLTVFSPETGAETTDWTWFMGRGRTLTFHSEGEGGEKYLCTENKLTMEDRIIGDGWEFQTWEMYGPWTPIPGTYFEGVIT